MNRYEFHSTLLVRTPAYPLPGAHQPNLQERVTEAYFQQALALANPSLLAQLERAAYNLEALKPKVKLSLANYLNRMHYRSVPFGLFSGFSVLRWGPAEASQQPHVLGPGKVHLLPDFEQAYRQLLRWIEEAYTEAHYYANPSLYPNGNTYRYLHTTVSPDQPILSFSLAVTDYEGLVRHLPKRGYHTYASLCQLLQKKENLSQADADASMQAMITGGILLPMIAQQQLGYKEGLHQQPVRKLPPAQSTSTEKTYANLERPLVNGSLSDEYQEYLKNGLTALQKLVPYTGIPDALTAFCKDFETRFDAQLVPLMTALDPELGVGYARLESAAEETEFIQKLALAELPETYKEIHWNGVHALLLKHMMEEPMLHREGIKLTESDLAALPAPDEPLPPGISILFRPMGAQVYIESAGGAHALTLSARFSLFNEEAAKAAAEMARHEIAHNPNVVFAELESVQDLHVANVERRPAFYNYKIQILTGADPSGVPAAIPLSDLTLTCRNGKAILWSQSLKKEVIPRLSTAFNYERSPLSVYRFLCDLQHQEHRTSFYLDLSYYFPYLSFYPRVSVGNAVLSLAYWLIGEKDIKAVTTARDTRRNIGLLRDLLLSKQCPDRIALTEGDQQLVYSLQEDEDMRQLLANIRGKKEVKLCEFPFALNARPTVQNTEGQPHLGQYVGHLLHSRPVFPDRTAGFAALSRLYGKKRSTPNWLYLKLYLHAYESDNFLQKVLYPFIKKAKSRAQIDRWFFIRYTDPDFHIRLRLHCKKPAQKAQLWQELNELLQPYLDNSTLASVLTDAYQQELERYAPVPIEEVEALFDADSHWVMEQMAEQLAGSFEYIRLAFFNARAIVDALIESLPDKLNLCQLSYDSLLQEHNGDHRTQSELSTFFQRWISPYTGYTLTLTPSIQQSAAQFLNKAQAIRQQLRDPAAATSFCGNILHMHINRYTPEDPRQHELMIYYFLLRHYQELKYRR